MKTNLIKKGKVDLKNNTSKTDISVNISSEQNQLTSFVHDEQKLTMTPH